MYKIKGWHKGLYWDGFATICAILYWIAYCCLNLDLLFFENVSIRWRLVFLVLLIPIAVSLRRVVYRAVIEKDAFSRKFLKFAAVHFFLLMIGMLLLWPGTWSWDDIHILNFARMYKYLAWQHYLSSVAIIVSGYFLPSAAGVVVVQLAVIACIVGYCLALLDVLYLDGNKKYHGVAIVLAELVFLLPPLLFYDYSKFRNTLCSYLEVLLFALVWRIVKFPKLNKVFHVILLLIVSVIVAAWRTENFYYAVLVFGFLIFAVGRKYWKECLAGTLVVCIAVFSIGRYNTKLIGDDDYEVVALINPVVALVRNAELNSNDGLTETQKQAISEIIDWDRVMSELDLNGSELYWDGAVLNYTKEEYREFQKVFLQLILKYPTTFLKERWGMFWDTSGFNDAQVDPYGSAVGIFVPGTTTNKMWSTNGDALNASLREYTLRLLAGRNADQSKNWSNHLFWNLFPPILFAFAALIFAAVRRKRLLLYVAFCNLFKVPLIFLTTPEKIFMYYMSVYLFGYMVAFFGLAIWFNRKCPAKTAQQIV